MTRLSHTLVALAIASVSSIAQGAAIRERNAKQAPKAIYYMNNDVANEVIAVRVRPNGKLGRVTTTPTGGAGSADIDPVHGGPNFPDALASSGSVRVVGNNVFAVNPGSNSLSMFSLDPNDPLKLTQLGSPVNTNGEFPVTVAVSGKYQLACVGNTGAVSGVACASYDPVKGLSAFDKLRDFKLNETTPPVDEYNSISTTFFSNDEEVLWSTVKGTPKLNTTGFLSGFRVENGKVGYEETRSSPAGTSVLFGATTIEGSTDILSADAAYGAVVISVDNDLKGTTKARTPIPGNEFDCWSAYSTKTGTGFIADGMVNHITEIDVQTGAIVSITNGTNPNFGMDDTISYGDFIYSLAPNTPNASIAVTVFDVSGGRGAIREIQNFLPGGAHPESQGLAYWV